MFVLVCFWTLYSVVLICVYICLLILHCLGYCIFMVSLKNWVVGTESVGWGWAIVQVGACIAAWPSHGAGMVHG